MTFLRAKLLKVESGVFKTWPDLQKHRLLAPFPPSSYSTPQNYSDHTLYDLTTELQYNRLQNKPSYPRSEPSASVMALRGCHWWCTAVKPAPWPHITSTLTSSEMHHSSPKNSDPKAPLVATGGPSVPLHTAWSLHCLPLFFVYVTK